MSDKGQRKLSKLQEQLHEIIFEADTPEGKFFDVSLLVLIVLSLVLIMLESVDAYEVLYGRYLRIAEWAITILFTIEYIIRLYIVRKPLKYALSFFGIIDLVSILPTYLSIFFAGSSALMVFRGLRLLRVFRVFKLARFVNGANVIRAGLRESLPKIIVFISTVLMVTLIMGCLMYLVEGEASGFTSIPKSIYWAIVTITTVGYGDISPVTTLGQLLASILMIMGYGVIAVPTGIVTSDLIKLQKKNITTQNCPSCTKEGHDGDAVHCKFCGEPL